MLLLRLLRAEEGPDPAVAEMVVHGGRIGSPPPNDKTPGRVASGTLDS